MAEAKALSEKLCRDVIRDMGDKLKIKGGKTQVRKKFKLVKTDLDALKDLP